MLMHGFAARKKNDGIVPDNVGLSGIIGEHIDGKWYGSRYGWSWPHGWHSVGQAVSVAAQNAVLLHKDLIYMDFPRSQIDVLIQHGIEHNDQLYVPQKYGDPGICKLCAWSVDAVSNNKRGWHCSTD